MKLSTARRYFVGVIAMVITVSLISEASAQKSSSIESLIREDVVAVASADLTKVELLKLNQWGTKTGLVSEKESGDLKFKLAAVQGIIAGLVDSGVDRISVLFQISDIQTQSPIWVASVNQDKDAGQAKDALKEVLAMLPLPPQVLQVKDGTVIGGPSQEALDSFLGSDPSTDPEIGGGLKNVSQHHVGLLVFGNPETRRVVREMFPDLPKPFEEATGELIADKAAWGGLFLDLPPEIDLEVVVQANDNQSAETIGRLATAVLQFAVKNSPKKLADSFGEMILEKITNEVTGSRVVVSGKALLSDQKLIANTASVANERLGREQKQKNIRNVIIAMHNYESAHQHFPTAAIYSDKGEPLLSWRVAILPFFGEVALFQEFHLDEPWDSPHNLKLAEMMPDIYANFGSASDVEAPKTTIQVPYGDGLFFQGEEPIVFADIRDGTSNTIAVVSTHPKNAVCWTKPADWEVDLKNPWEGLKRDGDEKIVVGFSDGAQYLWDPAKISKEELAAMLTRDGGETVKSPKAISP